MFEKDLKEVETFSYPLHFTSRLKIYVLLIQYCAKNESEYCLELPSCCLATTWMLGSFKRKSGPINQTCTHQSLIFSHDRSIFILTQALFILLSTTIYHYILGCHSPSVPLILHHCQYTVKDYLVKYTY